MLLGCTVLMVLLVRTINSACEPSLLENCARCCSMLFPTSDCDPSEVLRVKINGDGVLGAIVVGKDDRGGSSTSRLPAGTLGHSKSNRKASHIRTGWL
ncbi:hypothetical protein Q1695_012706 [Nippostrongylus brasiliensis]|nr:hypothetical protein Q1695_012706 [Nippostrongylus brasiliensis]